MFHLNSQKGDSKIVSRGIEDEIGTARLVRTNLAVPISPSILCYNSMQSMQSQSNS